VAEAGSRQEPHPVILSDPVSQVQLVDNAGLTYPSTMAETCTHLDQIREVTPSGDSCQDCLRTGDWWVHLRLCMSCGYVGCCDDSKNRHTTKHAEATGHPIIRSFEPGEEWFWCYPDELMFELEGAPPALHHS